MIESDAFADRLLQNARADFRAGQQQSSGGPSA
jgi:hypothetical protein